MQRIIVAMLGGALLVGCVSVSSSVLTRDFESRPVPPDQVYVFLASAQDELPESCVRVAVLHGSGASDWTDRSDMLDGLREEAGELGANAIYVQTMEDPGTGERVVGAIFGTGTDRDSDALALHCAVDDLPGGPRGDPTPSDSAASGAR